MRVFLLLLILLSIVPVIGQENPTPTAVPEALEISVWLPDVLASPEHPEQLTLLQEQTDDFVSLNADLNVTLRLKQVGTTGGIMSTLRTGSVVAPSTLPTLTLLRRQDLLIAQRSGLVQSIEGQVTSTLVADLANALPLGQIDGTLYGVPYVLDMQHLVYRPRFGVDYSRWDYVSVLQREQPFTFAAARSTGLNEIFLAQYLISGGSYGEDGELLLIEDALRSTYTFYEQAVESGLLDPHAAIYQTQQEYLGLFTGGEISAAVLDSATYLRLRDANNDLAIAALPSPDGQAIGVLNGWVWVVVTTSPDQRAAALRYVAWMMDADRLAEYARISYRLPARRTALLEPLAAGQSGQPFLDLMQNVILPITDSDSGTLGRLMQEGLIAVVSGERTAEQATRAILSQQPAD